jgi:5-methylcytosine-specific restriction protein A
VGEGDNMMKINDKMIEQVYIYAKKYYINEIELEKAVEYLSKEYKWDKGSAKGYIKVYKNMRNGERYTWVINGNATKYYLENIYKDNGYSALQIALKSVKLHIDYQENIQSINYIKNIYNNFINIKNIEYSYNNYNDESEFFFLEGKVKQVYVNIYERNENARIKCIEHYGYKCFGCGILLSTVYGELAKDFIHIHHITELSKIGKEYKVDPINDLRPLCPNCHAIIHRKSPALSIEELISIIKK